MIGESATRLTDKPNWIGLYPSLLKAALSRYCGSEHESVDRPLGRRCPPNALVLDP
jgi:hypothetical protein